MTRKRFLRGGVLTAFTAGAVFLGWLILHEKVDRFILAGSAIVVLSVILVTSAKVKEKTAGLKLPAVEAAGD